MSVTISKRQIAEVSLLLSALPFPPIPVRFTYTPQNLQDDKLRSVLDGCMREIVSSRASDDAPVSSHVLIASMVMLHRWSEYGKEIAVQERVKQVKAGVILRLMQGTLEIDNITAQSSTRTSRIYDVFYDATKAWVECYLPQSNILVLCQQRDVTRVGHESQIHISMSHYSCAQGILYSSKGSKLECDVHKDISQQLQAIISEVHAGSDEACDKIDTDEVRNDHMEISHLYSKYCYEKLLVLAYERILRDTLYGHADVDESRVNEQARELLASAVANYDAKCTLLKSNSHTSREVNADSTKNVEEGHKTCHVGEVTTDSTENVEDGHKTCRVGEVNTDSTEKMEEGHKTFHVGEVSTDSIYHTRRGNSIQILNESYDDKQDESSSSEVIDIKLFNELALEADTRKIDMLAIGNITKSSISIFIKELYTFMHADPKTEICFNSICAMLQSINDLQSQSSECMYNDILLCLNIRHILKIVKRDTYNNDVFINNQKFKHLISEIESNLSRESCNI